MHSATQRLKNNYLFNIKLPVISAAVLSLFFSVTLYTPLLAQPLEQGAPIPVAVAVLADFQPQYSLDANGRPTGFAIEVFERLAELANLEVSYIVKQNWEEVQQALKSGEADIIPNMGVTERRQAFANFTAPVETFPVSIFVRESETAIRGRMDLAWLSTSPTP
jgi:ABC-type amino acid transport substrate-binding protein